MVLCFGHSYAWFCSLTIQDLGRNARFAQIWKSRKGEKDEADESLREICHLYDAVQVDPDEEKKNPAEPRQVLLSNYLPVLLIWSCTIVICLTVVTAGSLLSKRVLFYATFFHLYGSTCHQLLWKSSQILFHWRTQKVCQLLALR